jgi:hypothetical protein
MTERQLVKNAIRAIRAHKKIAKDAALVAQSYTGELRRYHWRRAVKAARVARIEFDSLYW